MTRNSAFFAAFMFVFCGVAAASEKLIIGMTEEVVLAPWGVRLSARIDTGATISSFGTSKMKIGDEHVEVTVSSSLGDKTIRLPIIAWRNYKTTTGFGRRPVVRMNVCLGTKSKNVDVNIHNRSSMSELFLVGRNFLREDFIVNVDKSNSVNPICGQRSSP